MNIIKKYWIWDEEFNPPIFQLGIPIEGLVTQGLISKSGEGLNWYFGKDGVPWRIQSKEGLVQGVFYREYFFPFQEETLWDMQLKEFEETVNSVLVPASGDEKSDLLSVVFRGFFVAVVGIYRNR